MTVLKFPAPDDVNALWEKYHGLVKQCFADPSLWGDRRHQEQVIRAHKRFADAYLRGEAHAQAG